MKTTNLYCCCDCFKYCFHLTADKDINHFLTIKAPKDTFEQKLNKFNSQILQLILYLNFVVEKSITTIHMQLPNAGEISITIYMI